MVKKRLGKKDFYLQVLNEFKVDTNLSRIRRRLNISKQNLNYYIGKLRQSGLLECKGMGWYEVTENGKKTTKYSSKINEDSIRGHAYVWTIDFKHIPKHWDDRIKVLERANINFKLVGALRTTPRIKVMGCKVWLCNDNVRIFDKEKASYYGATAEESKLNARIQAFRILRVLENKLNISLSDDRLQFRKEHYAIVKNDLAKYHNNKGIILRISDEEGEWLLIDDSLEEGGELENVGKSAYKTNPKVQDWWNDQKQHDFKVTPSFILETLNKLSESNINQQEKMNELMLVTKALVQEVIQMKSKY